MSICFLLLLTDLALCLHSHPSNETILPIFPFSKRLFSFKWLSQNTGPQPSNLNTLQRLLTNSLLVVFFSGGRQLENNYISKIMFNIKSQSPDQRLRSFSPHPNIVSVQTWEKLGQFLPFCATDSLRPSTFSLLTLHPGLCGSLLTWTRQRLGAHAGVWVPWELGSSQTVGPCGSKAFKTLSGSSKWTNYPTLRLSDWHKLSIFLWRQHTKGE